MEIHLEAAGESALGSIRDYAEGVPEEFLYELCQPFFRVDDSRNSSTGGVGLGLAIASEPSGCPTASCWWPTRILGCGFRWNCRFRRWRDPERCRTTNRYHRIVRQPAVRKSPRFPGKPKSSSSLVLVLIGLFKLIKALLLVIVGIGAIKLLHKGLPVAVVHWVQLLRIDPDNAFVHRVISRIFRVTPKQLKELSVGTFLYAGLFTVEGLGLLFRKRWAEYFTIVTTGGLIPLEIYELSRHFTIAKTVVALVNVLIVWYLVARMRSR